MEDKKVGNLDFSKLNGEAKEEKVEVTPIPIETPATANINEEELFNPSFTGGLSGGNKIAGMNRKQNKESRFSGGLVRPNKKDNSNPFNMNNLGGIGK
jgi:hypothetical protein